MTDAFTGATITFGFTVGSICIKAGTVIHATGADGTFGNGCYTVSGLGTNTITFAETGNAGCKAFPTTLSIREPFRARRRARRRGGGSPSPSPSPSPYT